MKLPEIITYTLMKEISYLFVYHMAQNKVRCVPHFLVSMDMFLCCFLLPNAVCPQHLLSCKHVCLCSPFVFHSLCYELHLPWPLDELQIWLITDNLIRLFQGFINEVPCHGDAWGNEGICSSTILNLATRWRWVVSFMLLLQYLQGNIRHYPLFKRLGGPQN
jgi:hypothetical protein